MTTQFAAERVHEPPEVMGRNLRVASYLWSSATAFFFIAFLFAYFYLRALDQSHLWHPKHVKAPVTSGTLIAAAIAASGIAAVLASRRLRAGDDAGWRLLGVAAFVFGVSAFVIQIVQWYSLGFGPTDGGYASVFLGWTGLYALFLIGSLYWLETILATSFRHKELEGDERPTTTVSSGLEAFASYWVVLTGIGVITWVILYLL
jgi:heme/copper-type cytochrome/quinol oxidase subunit 3